MAAFWKVMEYNTWSAIENIYIGLFGLPSGSLVKNPSSMQGNAGDVGPVPGWGRAPGEGYGNPLQYSSLESIKGINKLHAVSLSWPHFYKSIYLYLYIFKGFSSGAVGKESTCKVGDTGDMGSNSRSGRYFGVANGNPLQYSCLENSMDRGA